MKKVQEKGADLVHPLLGSRKAWSNKESRGFLSQKGLKLLQPQLCFILTISSKKCFYFFAFFKSKYTYYTKNELT